MKHGSTLLAANSYLRWLLTAAALTNETPTCVCMKRFHRSIAKAQVWGLVVIKYKAGTEEEISGIILREVNIFMTYVDTPFQELTIILYGRHYFFPFNR